MNLALVYDRVNKIGGAEKILKALHQLWPNAPLYTAVYNSESAPWAKSFKVIPSFLQKLPFAKSYHEWYFWAAPMAFESFNFAKYDVVISITSAEAKGIITKPEIFHLCYLLTPTKYLWSHTHLYKDTNPLSGLGKLLLSPLLTRARTWDHLASQRPDQIVAISNIVAKRSKKYYQRQVDKVIYPPVQVGKFSSPKEKLVKKPFFLIVSRLVPSKRVDAAITAFNHLKDKLIIVGKGVEERKLKKMAAENISFVGEVSDSDLVSYYQHCQALIFPQEEDFGIVALEAQAAGRPVVAFNKGGAKETVIAGSTGIFFDDHRPTSIMEAIAKAKKLKTSPSAYKAQAKKFDQQIFKTTFKNYLENQWEKYHKNQSK